MKIIVSDPDEFCKENVDAQKFVLQTTFDAVEQSLDELDDPDDPMESGELGIYHILLYIF